MEEWTNLSHDIHLGLNIIE